MFDALAPSAVESPEAHLNEDKVNEEQILMAADSP